MPELPEVETVRKGLEEILADHPVIKAIELRRPDIRFPIPVEIIPTLTGQRIQSVRRRAKYLLIDTPAGTLLSHLGMTGSWRLAARGEEDIHDHCYVTLNDGRRLAFRDPRRFGLIDLISPGEELNHLRLRGLGVEPLDPDQFNADAIYRLSRRRKVPIKAFIMDQRIVVGVGNIYASEALFRAGLRPSRAAGRMTMAESSRLVEACRSVLTAAIAAGGSSISDYRQANGETGAFQNSHSVYDREGKPCVQCQSPIRSKVIGGRSTYWCSKCQK